MRRTHTIGLLFIVGLLLGGVVMPGVVPVAKADSLRSNDGPDQVAMWWADLLHVNQYTLAPSDATFDGWVVELGDGVYWAPVGATVITPESCEDSHYPVEWVLEEGVVIVVVDDGGEVAQVGTECDTGAGWYACCYCRRGCVYARCFRQGSDDSGCQGGGAGSQSCHLSPDDCPE